MDTTAKERFNAFLYLGFHFIDVLQLELRRTLLVTTQTGMGIHGHENRKQVSWFNGIERFTM